MPPQPQIATRLKESFGPQTRAHTPPCKQEGG